MADDDRPPADRAGGPVAFSMSDRNYWNSFRGPRSRWMPPPDGSRWEPSNRNSRGQKVRGWLRFAHTGEPAGFRAKRSRAWRQPAARSSYGRASAWRCGGSPRGARDAASPTRYAKRLPPGGQTRRETCVYDTNARGSTCHGGDYSPGIGSALSAADGGAVLAPVARPERHRRVQHGESTDRVERNEEHSMEGGDSRARIRSSPVVWGDHVFVLDGRSSWRRRGGALTPAAARARACTSSS